MISPLQGDMIPRLSTPKLSRAIMPDETKVATENLPLPAPI